MLLLQQAAQDALADGDRISCVVRGSAINNDGFSNGLTAPSPRAQEAVVRDACADAGVAPTDVQYVEAHGTGTMLGDPIEAGALGATLGAGRPKDRPLRIGSVKTNLGHLEAAAGMAGLIKVALSMEHGELPASLNFEKPNPHIPFEDLGLRVSSSFAPWDAIAGRRLAGVSSFGFGGTNSHVVLEAREAPEVVLLFGGQGSAWPGMGRALPPGQPCRARGPRAVRPPPMRRYDRVVARRAPRRRAAVTELLRADRSSCNLRSSRCRSRSPRRLRARGFRLRRPSSARAWERWRRRTSRERLRPRRRGPDHLRARCQAVAVWPGRAAGACRS